jgi:predicted ATPase
MLNQVVVENFKAIKHATVKISPLTVFIGNNGVGKSSLIEALELFQTTVTEGLNEAIGHWREFEHIYHKGTKKKREFERDGKKYKYAPLRIRLRGGLPDDSLFMLESNIGESSDGQKRLYFVEEFLLNGPTQADRTGDLAFNETTNLKPTEKAIRADRSIVSEHQLTSIYVGAWQFLSMNTFLMGDPFPQNKTLGGVRLGKDGRNVAEFLLAIRDKNRDVFDGILETLKFVLPYTKDLQPNIATELERMVYLQLTEETFKLPGWVLSTGTLKILALLAVFRNPEPSPLIVIEELENGLDPSTIHLIVEEIRRYLDDGLGQVLITTHSPYLLDLLHISQIVLVERKEGVVTFSRPGQNAEVKEWSKKFAPGQLYTQGSLKK